ncbi:MAG: hypothetical protein WCK51_13500 [Armatimonadota bacterium]
MSLIAALVIGAPSTLTKTKLNGILFGKSIVFDHVQILKLSHRASVKSGSKKDEAEVYVFTFQQGADLLYDNGIKFHVNLNPGSKLENTMINQQSLKFGTPEYSKMVHGHTTGPSCGRGALAVFIDANGKIESASDRIKFKFFCKALGNGEYKASIFGYAAEHKAGVQGNFRFKLEKA